MANETRDRLVELIYEARKQWDVYFKDCLLKGKPRTKTLNEFIADHLIENGVIVPPCKVGDTVYVFENCIWTDECCHCEHFQIGGFGDPNECARTKSPFKHPDCTEISKTIVTEKDIYLWLAYGDFGKTVFLTKAEAEQKLKEMRGGNDL